MNKKLKHTGIVLCLSAATMLLSGCGEDTIEKIAEQTGITIPDEDGNTDTDGGNTHTVGTGYYKDSGIEGVTFLCGKEAGITKAEGKFTFEIGVEKCVFSFGDVIVREVSGKDLKDGGTVWEDNEFIAQILQALDEDKNPENGIQISKETAELIKGLAVNSFPKTEKEFEDAIKIFKEIGIDLGNKDDALEHMVVSRLAGQTVYILDDAGIVISLAFAKDMKTVIISAAGGKSDTVNVSVSGRNLTIGNSTIIVLDITETGIVVQEQNGGEVTTMTFKKPETGTPLPTGDEFSFEQGVNPEVGQITYALTVMEDPETFQRTVKTGVLRFLKDDDYKINFTDGSECSGRWSVTNKIPTVSKEKGTCGLYSHSELNFTDVTGTKEMSVPVINGGMRSTSRGRSVVYSGFTESESSIAFGVMLTHDLAVAKGSVFFNESELINNISAKDSFAALMPVTNNGVYIYMPPASFENAIPVLFRVESNGDLTLGDGTFLSPGVNLNRVMLSERIADFGHYSRFYLLPDTPFSIDAALRDSKVTSMPVSGFNGSLSYMKADIGTLFWNYEDAVNFMEDAKYSTYIFEMIEQQYNNLSIQ